MSTKGIIVNVDSQTYTNLKSEQHKYHANMQKKISLAGVIMHYYEIGYVKANKSLYSGLRVVENIEDDSIKKEGPGLAAVSPDENSDIVKSMLSFVENREEGIRTKEEQVLKREEQLIEKLLSNDSSTSGRQFNQFQVDFARLNVELALLKDDFNIYKKGNNSIVNSKDFEKIEKSLALIESQTKRSTLESILPFATPLLIILGYFLMSKKMDGKMNIEGMQKQINMIFQKLNKKDQKIVTKVVEQSLDDIL